MRVRKETFMAPRTPWWLHLVSGRGSSSPEKVVLDK